jgi:hypothetical protein
MRSVPGLGSINAALISLYFAPVWGSAALRALTSPFYGFEDRTHSAAAIFLRELYDLRLDALIRVSSALSAVKFVIAAAFAAYLIDFARALVRRREPNRETLNAVLGLALLATMIWMWSAVVIGDGGLVRLYATEFLMLAGAVIVIVIERHASQPLAASPPSEQFARGPQTAMEALAAGALRPVGAESGVAIQRWLANDKTHRSISA